MSSTQRCIGVLCSKTRLHFIPFQHRFIRTAISASVNRGVFTNGSLRTQPSQRFKQQMCYYNYCTAKYLTTDAKENNYEGSAKTDSPEYSPALLPTTLPVPENRICLDADAEGPPSALEEISDEEALSISVPSIPTSSISLQDYVHKSETSTKLVQLGLARTDSPEYSPALLPTTLPMPENRICLDADAEGPPSALEEISDEEALSISVPSIPTSSFSLQDYVHKSETSTKLVQLGLARTDSPEYSPALLPTTLPMPENRICLDADAEGPPSALEEISEEEAVSISVPSIPPASFSLQDYVDKSETLTKLVQLGLARTDSPEYSPALLPTTLPMPENRICLDADAEGPPSALEEISDEEAVSISVSSIPPASFSLRDYVDKSETLTKLVQLGVSLWKLEQRPNVGSMLLRLDFSRDIAPRLMFLKQIGLEDSHLSHIITHNPFILTEDLENLQSRVNYLKSKKFTAETVALMVSKAPYLLNFSVKRLDNRLGFYQQQLELSPSNTRNIVSRLPKLLCGSLEPVKENLKVYKIEFGFKRNEIQSIVLAVPKVLIISKKKLTEIFDYLHNTMLVPHHLIAKFPEVFNTKFLRLRERHLFLEYLGKAQYDPTKPNYVALDRLVKLPDEIFCTEVALAKLEDFYLFEKTL